jgi:acyl carrier protein
MEYKKKNDNSNQDIGNFKRFLSYEAPVGEIEEEVARIWADILNTRRLGRTDNFFELGGNSLQAARIINKIYEEFGIELPVRTIFELQTIRTLAQKIEEVYAEVLGEEMDEGII